MEINEVKAQIKNKQLDNFYIFAGEEGYILKQYIDKIAEVSGARKQYVDSVKEVWPMLTSKSLIKEKVVYVVIDDKEFANTKYEQRWGEISDRVKDDILILQYTKVDKRIKFWKFFKNLAVFFEYLPAPLLMKYVQREIAMSDDKAKELVEICESDLGRILNEADKISCYMRSAEVNGYDMSADEAYETLLEEGVIYRPPDDAIFDFVAEVMRRKDGHKIYELLEQSYAVGEPNMVLITVLYNNFKQLLQVQTCNTSTIGKTTGLSGFQIKNVKPYVDRYSDDEIMDILTMLRELEVGIKTGDIRDEFTIHYFLGRML